jgi:hypothetical protein
MKRAELLRYFLLLGLLALLVPVGPVWANWPWMDASTQAGADPCAKITAGAATLTSGGIIDAGAWSGTQACTNPITLPTNVTLMLPPNLTLEPTALSLANNSAIIGQGSTSGFTMSTSVHLGYNALITGITLEGLSFTFTATNATCGTDPNAQGCLDLESVSSSQFSNLWLDCSGYGSPCLVLRGNHAGGAVNSAFDNFDNISIAGGTVGLYLSGVLPPSGSAATADHFGIVNITNASVAAIDFHQECDSNTLDMVNESAICPTTSGSISSSPWCEGGSAGTCSVSNPCYPSADGVRFGTSSSTVDYDGQAELIQYIGFDDSSRGGSQSSGPWGFNFGLSNYNEITVGYSAWPGAQMVNAPSGASGIFHNRGGGSFGCTNAGFRCDTMGCQTGDLAGLIRDANTGYFLPTLATTGVGSTAVNYLNVTNAATGNPVAVAPVGTDTNINLTLAGKGTGAASINGNAATATALASTPSQCATGALANGIAASGNANCLPASPPAVNGLYLWTENVTGSAAVAPTLTATSSLPAGTAIGTLDTGSPTWTGASNIWNSNVNVNVTSGSYLLGYYTVLTLPYSDIDSIATGIGALASQNATSEDNTATGNSALNKNTSGSRNTADGYVALYSDTTGAYNTGVGEGALYGLTTGSDNTGVGNESGYTGTPLTTGSNNTFLGYHSAATGAADVYENVLGALTTGYGSYTTTLGAQSVYVTGPNSTTYGGAAVGPVLTGCAASFGTTSVNTGSATTTTAQSCLPANSVIDFVVYRVTTAITTATSFTVGKSGSTSLYCGSQTSLTLGSTGICFAQTGSTGAIETSAAAVVVTFNTTPGAGAMRIEVISHTAVPPTS